GDITAAAEFNFYLDPEAADTVISSGLNILVVPWAPLTINDAIFDADKLEQIATTHTTLARLFTKGCAATLEVDDAVGIPAPTHPYSLSAAVLLHPELITAAADYNVQIETGSELTRGYSAMSWGVHGLSPNARVVEAVDGQPFFDLICTLLATNTAPSREIEGLR